MKRMKTADMRFDVKITNELIGKPFHCYRCDAFDFTNSVTQLVGLYIGNEIYTITNMQETVDYFGTKEDIAVCRFDRAAEGSVTSAFRDTELIRTPIGGIIARIVTVNENQTVLTENEEYNIWLTRGIIFEVDGREISFEKDIVPFSEEIVIQRGYHLLDKFSDENCFLDGWPDDVKAECRREICEFSQPG